MTRPNDRGRILQVGYTFLLIASFVSADDAAPAGDEKPREASAAEIIIPDAGTELTDAGVARREVARFQTAMGKAKSDVDRIKSLERLAKWNHAAVCKAAQKYLKHKSHLVAVQAVTVVARQPSARKKAGAALTKQLKKERRNHVKAALLVGLGVLEFEDRWVIKEALGYMRRDHGVMHLAATRYLGYIRHKPAFRILAENLDEPKAASPNSPTNPPASYWKERWFEWDRNKAYTRWAISRLVPGESFTLKSEAKGWAEAEGKKHGIKW